MKRLNILVIILFGLVFLSSCLDNPSDKSEESSDQTTGEIIQGVVTYDVEFPFIDDPTLIKWFPTEYITRFNEDEMYGEMNSRLNVITNRFYSNQKDFILQQTLENMSGNYLGDFSESDVDKMVNQMPDMIISEPHGDTVIVGLKCKMSYAEFKTDSVPAVILYYTDQIKVSSPNWFNQYRSLDEFLLGYEIEQFGMRMKLMAKDLKIEKTNIESSEIYAGKEKTAYTELSGQELKSTFKKMLVDFMQ